MLDRTSTTSTSIRRRPPRSATRAARPGTPRVRVHHRGIVLNSAMTANMHGRTGDDICYTALPCARVYGNVVMNGIFFLGGTLVLADRFDPLDTMGLIERHRATIFDGVPTMYMVMLADPKFDDFDLSSLRLFAVGGQTMPEPKIREVGERFGCPFIRIVGNDRDRRPRHHVPRTGLASTVRSASRSPTRSVASRTWTMPPRPCRPTRSGS